MTDLERIKKDVVEMDSRANVCWYDTKVLTKAVRLILEELTADRKTEPQTIRCPKCGRTDYIRDMEKDMGIKDSHYKYKCINCNTYIKDEPQTEREGD